MNCPKCHTELGSRTMRTTNVRHLRDGSVRRRRQCLGCGERFATLEQIRSDVELVEVTSGSLWQDLRGGEGDGRAVKVIAVAVDPASGVRRAVYGPWDAEEGDWANGPVEDVPLDAFLDGRFAPVEMNPSGCDDL